MGVISDIRSGAAAVLAGIPGIAQISTARPAAVGALPMAFVDEIRVGLSHTSGVRYWDGELDVYLVLGGFDNEEAQAAADDLLELVVDAFSDAPHMAGALTVSEPVRVRSGTVDNGNGVTYPAWIVTVGRFTYSEGR